MPDTEMPHRDDLHRRLLAVAPLFDVIYEWNLTTQHIVWSDNYWRCFGFRKVPENQTYAFWREQVHPDDLKVIEPSLLATASSPDGTLWEAEYRFRRADGTWAWISDRAMVCRPEPDSPGGRADAWMIGAMRDVTEHRQVLQKLAESEARYRAVAHSTAETFWWMDSRGEFLEPSEPLCRLLGIAREDVFKPDFDWRRYIHPDDLPRVEAAWFRSVRTGEPYEQQERMRLADGSYRWFVVRAVAVRDPSGSVVEWVGTHRDIHAEKVAEQLLREVAVKAQDDRARLEQIVERLPVAVVLADPTSGRMTYASERARQHILDLVGSDDPEVFERTVELFDAAGNRLPREQWPLARASRGERVQGMEVTYRSPRCTLTALVDGLQIHDERLGGSPVVLMCYRDITQLKAIEAELRSASEAKDRFLAVLSHELRTPLTPVLTSVQILQNDPSMTAETREMLGVIRRNVELEARLIDDLLDLTRVSRGKLRMDRRPVDLPTLLSNVVDICRPDLRAKGLRLEFETDATVVAGEGPASAAADGRLREDVVYGDAARLHQVFWNLLKNAIKFTPEGGSVTVRFSHEPPKRPGEPAWAVVTVRDTGIGIPASLLPRVFDAFMQGEHDARRFGGLGLGLAIARALVELHGGTLSASSDGEQQGATFHVRLPLGIPRDAPLTAAPAEPTTAGPRLRILLVEDHADTARVLQRLLRHFGHVTVTASTVSQALSILRAGEKFDLMISDIGLPDGSGYDLMQQSAGIRPPAIALSGFGMDDDLRRSRNAGFVEHLTKPVDAAYLEQVIQRVARETSAAPSP
ncbi:MAG: PAS domain-containing protein [Tepidisphaerales bacterium]